MTATEILSELARRGVDLEVHGDRLRFRPKEAVTPALLEVLREHKAALLARLDGEHSVCAWPARRCYRCNGFLFWRSVLGAVVCAQCHPPAAKSLVGEWWWLPEGQAGSIQ